MSNAIPGGVTAGRLCDDAILVELSMESAVLVTAQPHSPLGIYRGISSCV